MPPRSTTSFLRTHADGRVGAIHRGTATLELVLSMPVLLALIVGIVWLGSAVIAQTAVTIEARHNTWSKRHEPIGTALLFLKDDVVSDEATEEVNVSPVFAGVDPPASSHDVMAGTWDFEKLPFDKPPHWEQYAIAAANAKTAAIQNAYVDARNMFTQFQSEAGNIWQTLGASLIRQLISLGEVADSALEGGENAGAGEKSVEQARINRELNAKRNELKEAREALRNLDDDASAELRDVFKNRVKRLEAEIDDLEADLEALD